MEVQHEETVDYGKYNYDCGNAFTCYVLQQNESSRADNADGTI